MKAGTFIAALSCLLMAASAQPVHKRRLQKREVVTHYVVVEIPEIVVWVDGSGNTVKRETKGEVVTRTYTEPPTGATTFNQPPPTDVDEGFIGVVAPNETPEQTTSEEPATTTSHSIPAGETIPASPKAPYEPPEDTGNSTEHSLVGDTAPPVLSTPDDVSRLDDQSFSSSNGLGICYAPYQANGNCKSQSQVNNDFTRFSGYKTVRSYGVDCDQISHLVNAAKNHNKKLFIGVFDLGQLQKDLQTLIRSVGGSWDLISTVSIGNELVNTGKSSVQDVVNAVNSARSTLRAAGYNGPVVTVDTFNQIIAHPQLCHASDFCAANCHPFFDPNTKASEAGAFVKKQAGLVSAAAGGKRTVITETGWPHNGSPNGEAKPSRQNQDVALASLRKKFANTNGELFLFSAFDDKWKVDNQWTFGTEKFWGML